MKKSEVKQIIKMNKPTSQDIEAVGKWLVDNFVSDNTMIAIKIMQWYQDMKAR